MVATKSLLRLASVVALTLVCGSVRADDLLERIQVEVSEIVKATKGAVVSIEDERGSIVSVRGIDIDKIMALVNDDTEKSLRAELEKLKNIEGKPGESAKMKADRAMKSKEINEKLQEAHRVAQEALKNVVPFLASDAPKSGTGFSIGNGYIVTTADVVEGMENPVIVTDQGVRIKGTIVNIDGTLNIGLIKLAPGAELPAVKWGDSSRLAVGYFGISIGNQNGQMNSVSLNLVAGLRGDGTMAGRRFYPTLIQVAGTVAAGSSGAPLMNARGEVVGMMAAVPAGDWTESRVPTPGGGAFAVPGAPSAPGAGPLGGRIKLQGRRQPQQSNEEDSDDPSTQAAVTFLRPPVTSAGFAIPSNDVRQVVEVMRGGKRQARGWLGVTTKSQTKYVQDGPYLRPVVTVKIETVYAGSPAVRAGLESGDIIISLKGKPITSAKDVRDLSISLVPGETIAAVIKRGSEERSYVLQIDARPEAQPQPRPRTKTEAKRTSSLPSGHNPAQPAAATGFDHREAR